MGRVSFAFFLVIYSIAVFGQSNPNEFKKLNSIQLEMSGAYDSFIPISLNYERVLHQTRRVSWNAKLGGIYKMWGNKPQRALTLEVGAVSLGQKHHVEVGFFTMLQHGVEYFGNRTNGGVLSAPFYLAARGGYRYQLADDKFIFRAGVLQPILMHIGDEQARGYKVKFTYRNNRVMLWPVLSFGRAF